MENEIRRERNMKSVTFRLSPEEIQALDAQAAKEYRRRSDLLRMIVAKYLKKD